MNHNSYIIIITDDVDLVQCSTNADCTGNLTTMTMRQCCVENDDGLSFTVNSTCHTCIGKLECMLFCNSSYL